MYLMTDLHQKCGDLSCLLRLITQRIDLYINSIQPEATANSAWRRSHVNEITELKERLTGINSNCQKTIAAALSKDNFNYHYLQQIIGNSFTKIYNEVWDIEQNLTQLNEHKSIEQHHDGPLTDCLNDIMKILEIELIAHMGKEAHKRSYISREHFCLTNPHQQQITSKDDKFGESYKHLIPHSVT